MVNTHDPPDECLTILVVDDEAVNRLILRRMLSKEGHTVLQASNGREAVETFAAERPDMVLMDVMMPEMDGYEATARIKALTHETFAPIIFLTALSDEWALAKCVACGGDDFLGKPYSPTLLKAKINAMTRILRLNKAVERQRDELLRHRALAERELDVGQQVLSKLIRQDELEVDVLKYSLTPLNTFSGDLFLAACRPNGVQHVLLGDFTGHGLSAALGAIPVAETFYTMTSKGFCTADIARSINFKLNRLLPTGMYCAAAFIEIDYAESACWVWNGGVPSVYIVDGEGKLSNEIQSQHLPLGIGDDSTFDDQVEMTQISPSDRIYVLSDGVVESRNAAGEMFGEERVLAAVSRTGTEHAGEIGIERLTRHLQEFLDQENRSDDITYAEILCDPSLAKDTPSAATEGTVREPMSWSTHFVLSGPVLRHFDPVPALMTQLIELQGLDKYRQSLHVILSELFRNALDHGVLGLSSSLKDGPNGFEIFYDERQKRLDGLTDGRIEISMEHEIEESGSKGRVIFDFLDSGDGFDVEQVLGKADLGDNTRTCGRGLALMKTLCESVGYSEGGRRARAVFTWGGPVDKALAA